jgi:hypothetical protein
VLEFRAKRAGNRGSYANLDSAAAASGSSGGPRAQRSLGFLPLSLKEIERMAGKKGGKGGGKAAGKGGNLVVASKVKEMIRASGCRASGDLVEAVSAKINSVLREAVGRCKANSRGTVRPQDL